MTELIRHNQGIIKKKTRNHKRNRKFAMLNDPNTAPLLNGANVHEFHIRLMDARAIIMYVLEHEDISESTKVLLQSRADYYSEILTVPYPQTSSQQLRFDL